MAKYDENKIAYANQERLLNLFCKIIRELKNEGKIKRFLKDLLNRKERIMLIRRLLIAEMLQKEETYQKIAERLHCGYATIARVQRWLRFGRGGYQEAIRIKRIFKTK